MTMRPACRDPLPRRLAARRAGVLVGAAVVLWLAGVCTAVTWKAWVVLALLLAVGAVAFAVLHVIAHRD